MIRHLGTTALRSPRLRLLSTLTIVEHASGTITPGSLSAITAANALGGDVTALVAGQNLGDIASKTAKINGVSNVYTAEDPHYDHGSPESTSMLVTETLKAGGFTHLVAASSAFGRNIVPRVGALLDKQPITDVVKILGDKKYIRPIYAGNALATVESSEDIQIISVRPTAFDPAIEGDNEATVEAVPSAYVAERSSEFVSEELMKSERPDLASAPRVVAGGRGLKDKEGFEKIMYPLADVLGAAVGASRAAVDSGFCDNSLQVGQTGKVVAPELYLAVGISGAIQHLAGMKDAKVIAAVNKNEDEPIIQIADVSLVGDLFEEVPKITDELKN